MSEFSARWQEARGCKQARAVAEILKASGIEAVSVAHHFAEVHMPPRVYVTHIPLPFPPTWHYLRRGGWYEFVGMPKSK